MATSSTHITIITSDQPATTLPDTQNKKRKLDFEENQYSHFSTKKRKISQSTQPQALEPTQQEPLKKWEDFEKALAQGKKILLLNQHPSQQAQPSKEQTAQQQAQPPKEQTAQQQAQLSKEQISQQQAQTPKEQTAQQQAQLSKEQISQQQQAPLREWRLLQQQVVLLKQEMLQPDLQLWQRAELQQMAHSLARQIWRQEQKIWPLKQTALQQRQLEEWHEKASRQQPSALRNDSNLYSPQLFPLIASTLAIRKMGLTVPFPETADTAIRHSK